MKKHFSKIIFAVVSVFLLIYATWVLMKDDQNVAVRLTSELFFPGFEKQIDQVSQLVVQTGEDVVTLQKNETGWVVAEKDGYKANAELIRRNISGLADLRKIEPKTQDPENHDRMGVGVNAPVVRLFDAQGQQMLALVVGDKQMVRDQAVMDHFYARQDGQNQVWLVMGDMDVRQRAVEWVDSHLINIGLDRVQKVQLLSGAKLTASRTRPGKTWHVDVIAQNGRVDPQQLGSLLNFLQFTDVTSVNRISGDFTPWAIFTTFDGLVFEVKGAKINDQYWVAFSARVDERARIEGEAENAFPSLDEMRAEVQDINNRLMPYVYKLPQTKMQFLQAE